MSNKTSVNFHLTKICNAKCTFCFATFGEIPQKTIPEEEGKAIIRLLLADGVQKINFAGGEPTIVPFLGRCLELIKQEAPHCITSIVTNGKRLTSLLNRLPADTLDWVGLSVDSADDRISAQLGRCRPGQKYAELALQHADLARARGVRVKLNSVITRLNHQEDMHPFVARLAPERWKIFQTLPVKGQNDGKVEPLLISAREFEGFVQRHRSLEQEGIVLRPENNDDMQISYRMISPDGRFYDDSDGHHYSEPILKVGVERALEQVQFSLEKFSRRGGDDYFKPSGDQEQE